MYAKKLVQVNMLFAIELVPAITIKRGGSTDVKSRLVRFNELEHLTTLAV